MVGRDKGDSTILVDEDSNILVDEDSTILVDDEDFTICPSSWFPSNFLTTADFILVMGSAVLLYCS